MQYSTAHKKYFEKLKMRIPFGKPFYKGVLQVGNFSYLIFLIFYLFFPI